MDDDMWFTLRSNSLEDVPLTWWQRLIRRIFWRWGDQ